MIELQVQGTYVKDFFTQRTDGLQYNWVSASNVNPTYHMIPSDLKAYLSQSDLNKKSYAQIVKEKYNHNEDNFIVDLMAKLTADLESATNAAIFFNTHKSFTFNGYDFSLFAPSGSELRGDKDFCQNIFSVVEEYTFKDLKKRPDLSFFLNGVFFAYSELKSNLTNQYAKTNGIAKVYNDFCDSVRLYHKQAGTNDVQRTLERKLLFPFCKSIHITTTDINETYVVRNIIQFTKEIREALLKNENNPDLGEAERLIKRNFKPYPLRNPKEKYTPRERFEEVMSALYSKRNIEKEILYYNFIEYKWEKDNKGTKVVVGDKNGRLISPRPKQKFGADKIMARIPEFLEHENEPDYFCKKLEKQLREDGVNEIQIKEAIEKRRKYQNNKNVYSLLLQYAAGFGKSNIIGWTALQLKDLRDKDGKFVYDKIMIVVDRLQLRDQLDSTLQNMNIQKGMFEEATNSKTFKSALKSSKRIIVVNIQKFGGVSGESDSILDAETMYKLSKMRVCFIIDEVHRTNSGELHEDMLSVFDELQAQFDNSEEYVKNRTKKNLIIGFTATPSDNTLARFGEFSKYQESEIRWVPFDCYTMREAIKDGFILDPTIGIIPVAAKMFFEEPEDDGSLIYGKPLDQMTAEELEKIYRIRKEKIYSNIDRIEAISKFIVDRLLKNVYSQIRGEAKAMLAVSSIPNAIEYHRFITEIYKKEVSRYSKYERFKDAPIYIVYSERQGVASATSLNGELSEQQVLKEFRSRKNGLIIVVDKLQTGFDEPKLHTLFLDKEIRGINAIQTISRVNRTCKNKVDCKILDFSYQNCNVKNIKKAFAKFADMVVSEFNPFDYEKRLKECYRDLIGSEVYKGNIKAFKAAHEKETFDQIEDVNDKIREWIKGHLEDDKAYDIRVEAGEYSNLLNILLYLLEIEKKYKDSTFLYFWSEYCRIYREFIKGNDDPVVDIQVYFDNTIGMLETQGEEDVQKPRKGGAGKPGQKPRGGNKDRIIEEIRKRNEVEEEIEALVKEFRQKIESFFEYIKQEDEGKRLIAKIQSKNATFSKDEIMKDFSSLARRYILLNNKILSDFFKREFKASLDALYETFVEENNIE